MDAEINNVIYMELYSGPKMVHNKYEKTNVARSTDQDSTVYYTQSKIHTLQVYMSTSGRVIQ
jgi:hypothetical protein